MDFNGRIGCRETEETVGGGLAEITGAGINFARVRSAASEFECDARANCGGIARESA